jgi:hypothetical protein
MGNHTGNRPGMPYKNKLRVLRLTALAIKFTHSQFKTFSDFRVIYRGRE